MKNISYKDKVHGCDELGEWYYQPRGDSHKLKVIEKYRNHNNAEMEADLATLEFKIIRLKKEFRNLDIVWPEYMNMSNEIDDIIMEQARRIHGGTDTERKLWRGN